MAGIPLSHLPSGSDVFIDANIFVYAFCFKSKQCLTLLNQCAKEEIFGVTTLEVVNEATHRLMLAEALAAGIITKDTASNLNKHASQITRLQKYWNQTSAILRMNLVVFGLDENRIFSAHNVRAADGLLTNDSMIVAAMKDNGLTVIISADKGFDHIGGLLRYEPTDLP